MVINKLHADEVDINLNLIKSLLKNQCSEFADLEIEAIHPSGTDNAMFYLGDNKVLRMPRMASAAESLEKECKWLPKLAEHLPIAIPNPLFVGEPDADYSFRWYISERFVGSNPTDDNLELIQAATDLTDFILALREVDITDAPKSRRGVPLKDRDTETRESIPLLNELYDTNLLTSIWEESLAAPIWTEPDCWIHSDLHAGNLLADNGHISAVLDFGMAGVGDPACDLMVAWTLLDKDSRSLFKNAVGANDDIWLRARGWALHLGIVAYPYYHQTNPQFAAIAKRAIDQILENY